jgi:hypothetical protein
MKKEKNQYAVEMGKKGGKARWDKVGKKKKSQMMRELALKRWATQKISTP